MPESSFSEKILHWYSGNKRPLPWRNTKNPYKIWLSEILLQQTRVSQGTPYYEKFLKKYPTVYHLANAEERDVLKLWQGLGYYSRARNLHQTARTIAFDNDGVFPQSYDELIQLKGVGDYTASAIASICFDKPEPVVDGNVNRVLARYFGVQIPVNGAEGIRYFKTLARKVMDPNNIRDYNQGLMEFGAIQCTPQRPDCTLCPLNTGCLALQQNKIHLLPVKVKKAKIKKRYFNYLVVLDPACNTILKERTGKGIWQHLFEFPLVETKLELSLPQLRSHLPEVLEHHKFDEVFMANEEIIIHKLTHQHLHTRFWIVKIKELILTGIPAKELENYPVPVLIANFIKTHKNVYFC